MGELYDIDEGVLGEGIQGVVRTVVHKQTGLKYAMKTVPLGAGQVRLFSAYRHVLLIVRWRSALVLFFVFAL